MCARVYLRVWRQNERKKSHYHCLIYYPVGNACECECKYMWDADNRTTNNFCFYQQLRRRKPLWNDFYFFWFCATIFANVCVFTADLTQSYELIATANVLKMILIYRFVGCFSIHFLCCLLGFNFVTMRKFHKFQTVVFFVNFFFALHTNSVVVRVTAGVYLSFRVYTLDFSIYRSLAHARVRWQIHLLFHQLWISVVNLRIFQSATKCFPFFAFAVRSCCDCLFVIICWRFYTSFQYDSADWSLLYIVD